jgi:hypothetical protein
MSGDIPTTGVKDSGEKMAKMFIGIVKLEKREAQTDTNHTASTSCTLQCTIANVLMGLSHEIYLACDGMCG